MIKLSEMKWNPEVVKELTFEEFKVKVDHFVIIGKLLKCTDLEIRKFYEGIADKVETLKK
jgi:hypothetical protein